jgi:hypothetical protein
MIKLNGIYEQLSKQAIKKEAVESMLVKKEMLKDKLI